MMNAVIFFYRRWVYLCGLIAYRVDFFFDFSQHLCFFEKTHFWRDSLADIDLLIERVIIMPHSLIIFGIFKSLFMANIRASDPSRLTNIAENTYTAFFEYLFGNIPSRHYRRSISPAEKSRSDRVVV